MANDPQAALSLGTKAHVAACLLSLVLGGCTCVYDECAGGTRVSVQNNTSMFVRIEYVGTYYPGSEYSRIDESGTASIEPGGSFDIIRNFALGNQARSEEQSIERIRLLNSTGVFYDGPVAVPPFEVDRHEYGYCTSADFTLTLND